MTGSNESAATASGTPRRRRKGLAVLLGLAVLAGAGVGSWATDTWPFDKESYCWGAWHEDDSDDEPGALDEVPEGYERTGEQSAPPRKGERATCSVTLKEKADSADSADSTTGTGDEYGDSPAGDLHEDRITAEVAPVRRGKGARAAWLSDFLGAQSAPLPDGLPGLVGRGRAAFVLPEKCDAADGRPTVVTLEGSSDTAMSSAASMGSEADVADLLLSLANHAAEQAGCAPGEPFEVTSPLAEATADDSLAAQGSSLCRIPGFRFRLGKDDHYRAHVGAVRDDLQVCSVADRTDVRAPTPAGQFVMVSRPRLAALFTGLAEDSASGKGWRGRGEVGEERALLTADCGGRPTVFFMQLDGFLSAHAEPGPRQVFAATANSVADRLGCRAVASTS
ncbi:hypothetical protein [Streptomyces spirodelae]|uniref:Secreted protein n=1 Tax=Streptomyces spirodelae TaxID=2812904 RepID=A0ABS3WN69_9ACTN|nr:hypothetical protein [Streptomyces spirodelae]MBO8184540.1 hypothetical protein [Streptomyces spirodelae]